MKEDEIGRQGSSGSKGGDHATGRQGWAWRRGWGEKATAAAKAAIRETRLGNKAAAKTAITQRNKAGKKGSSGSGKRRS